MPHPARRPTYYKKLLRTMLLTFLMPAVIATGILCAFQVRGELQRAKQAQTVDAARLTSVLSGQLDTAAQMAFHCANDSFIVSLSKREYDVLTFAELSADLRTLKAANSYIEDIMIYYAGHPMTYTTDGIYPAAASATGLTFNGMLIDEYTSDMARRFTFDRVAISRTGKVRESLCYLYSDLVHPGIRVLVTLDPRTLGYGEEKNTAECWMALSQTDGKILLSHGMSDELAAETMKAVASAPEGGMLRLASGKYLSTVEVAENYGIRYVMLTPISRFLPSALYESLLILAAGLTVMLLAAVMITRIAGKTYAPVKELYTSVRSEESGDTEDEFGVIGSALSNLKSTVDRQGQALQSQIPAVRMQLLSRLINGVYESAEDFNYVAASSGMALTQSYYLTFIAACAPEEAQEDPVLAMEQEAGGEWELYGCQTLSPDMYLFVMSTAEPGRAQRFLSSSHEKLKKRLGESFTLYVSTCCQEFARIGQTAVECRTLYDTLGLNGLLNVFHNDQRDVRQLLYAAAEMEPLLSRLRQAIYDGNVEEAKRCLEAFDEQRSRWELSAFAGQCVSFDLINCVLGSLNGLLNQQESVVAEPLDLSGLASFRSPRDLTHAASELGPLIEKALNRQNGVKKGGRPEMKEILSYIQAHYSDYDFSVKQVAEYANMSLSAFSQYFRAQCGVTVIDYVLNRRIDAAKEKLAGTDMLISEIVFSIGYVSVPSFVNKFKRVTGMTPGEYREQARTRNSSED